MTSDRPYRKALPIKHAINELREFTGTQFDPHVVEAFIKVLEKELYVQALEKKELKETSDIRLGMYKAQRKLKQALEKQVEDLKITDCHCSAEETTGWTTSRLCNVRGKIQKK